MGATEVAKARLARARSRSSSVVALQPPAPPTVEAAVGSRPTAKTWKDEWKALRAAELALCQQRGLAHGVGGTKDEREAWVQKNEGHKTFAARQQLMVRYLRYEAEWPPEEAEAYACVSLGGLMALGEELRRCKDSFAASTHLLCESLWRRGRRAAQGATGSDEGGFVATYRHLSGIFGLLEADPGWSQLLSLDSDTEPGAVSFVTSALTIATDDDQCFLEDDEHRHAKGYRVRLSTQCGTTRYEAQHSDIVKFHSLPPEAEGEARSLVRVSPWAFHGPPCMKVTVMAVKMPLTWTAHGRYCERKLYEVNVSYVTPPVAGQSWADVHNDP